MLQRVASDQRVPAWLLDALIAKERSPAGRRGRRGINVQFRDLLDHARSHGEPTTSESRTPRFDTVERYALRQLRIQNFGPFALLEVSLRRDQEHPICLVEANNGSGKSHLVKAILFALGIEPDEKSHKYPARMLHQGADEPVLRVLLQFESSGGEFVDIERTIRFDSSGAVARKSGARHVIRFHDERGPSDRPLEGGDAREWLAIHFPPEIIRYFVFDAEASPISQLSGELGESLPSMEEEVEEVLGIKAVREAATRLRGAQVRGQFEKKLEERRPARAPAAIERQLAEYRAEQKALRARYERELKELREKKDQREKNHRIVQQLQEQLKHRGSGEREKLEKRLERLRGRREQEANRLASSLERALPLRLLLPVLEGLTSERSSFQPSKQWLQGARYAARRIADQVVAGELPWDEPHPDAAAVYQRLLALLGLPDTATEAHNRPFDPEQWADRARHVGAVGTVAGELIAIDAEQRRCQGRIEALPPTADTSKLTAQLSEAQAQGQRLEEACRELQRRVDEHKSRIDVQQREITRLQEELPEARNKQRAVIAMEKKLAFVESLASALDVLAGELRRGQLARVEDRASELLRRISNKPELHRVAFDPHTCRFRLEDRHGNEVPPDRSTGEKTVLALAIVHGLRGVALRRLPLVIEAPLRPLDPDHEQKVVEQHFAQLEDHTVLMEVPGRFGQRLLDHMRPRLGQYFVIEHDSGKGRSEIEERAIPAGDRYGG